MSEGGGQGKAAKRREETKSRKNRRRAGGGAVASVSTTATIMSHARWSCSRFLFVSWSHEWRVSVCLSAYAPDSGPRSCVAAVFYSSVRGCVRVWVIQRCYSLLCRLRAHKQKKKKEVRGRIEEWGMRRFTFP